MSKLGKEGHGIKWKSLNEEKDKNPNSGLLLP